MSAGVYLLYVGEVFYIGSTSNFARRFRDHAWRLKGGFHPVPSLQAAYDGQPPRMLKKGFLQRGADEATASFRDRLRVSEQLLMNEHRGNPQLVNRSLNARGPNNSEWLKSKWADADHRLKMVKFLKARKGVMISEQTRERMAVSKRGSNNVRARAVILTHADGSVHEFVTATAAACFVGVSQQLMQSWLTGKAAWPGTKGRTKFGEVAKYSGRFKDL